MRRDVGMLLTAASLAACASSGSQSAGVPVADPESAAAALIASTHPDSPLQVTFSWMLDEAGSRLRGRGVARLQAPDRIRLDLFGPRGETYLSAALVGEEFHLPAATSTGQLALPSPALLWAAVGVVRPPEGARLLNASTLNGQLLVRYGLGDEETLEYVASDEGTRLLRATRNAPSSHRETLNLSHGSAGDLTSARYRDLGAYRELVLGFEALDEVAPFPSSIWRPDVETR